MDESPQFVSADHNLKTDPETWLDRHGDPLYRYAMLRVGRRPDVAAELVQETFVGALQNLEGFDGRCDERTWLLAILKHKLLDYYRRMAREPETLDPEVVEQNFDVAFNSAGFWKSRPVDPYLRLEQEEFRESMMACLSRLPAHLAAPFIMREVDGASGEEICQALGISAANLWARLHRARLLLRACLEKNWTDREGGIK